MAEHRVTISKRTVRGKPRFALDGMASLYIPDEDAREIISNARDRFDIDDLDDDTKVCVVIVEDEPEHHVTHTQWRDP